ncbi:MAG: hypothetical protein K0Q75_21 [Anaerospora sp.]|nr:hypothetical protein [Anaerospora sp.]
MEIGGFREIDLRQGFEYYTGNNVARLNSGRYGIYHALKLLNCSKILLPYYQCNTVRDYLLSKNIEVIYYDIDERFYPKFAGEIDEDCGALIVNYFGLIPEDYLKQLSEKNKNIIVDNTQGFFCKPTPRAYSIYSPRKFFGVPDGCYVYGKNVNKNIEDYKEDYSSYTSLFLLSRIETGGNVNYPDYCKNEERITNAGICRMSKLTHALLDNIDYTYCLIKRKENFQTARELFDKINCLSIDSINDSSNKYAPMVYPLIIKNDQLRYKLVQNKIFVGHWWEYLIRELPPNSLEVYYSKYLIPIQIDHRYNYKHLKFVYDFIKQII